MPTMGGCEAENATAARSRIAAFEVEPYNFLDFAAITLADPISLARSVLSLAENNQFANALSSEVERRRHRHLWLVLFRVLRI
jgi:hypothetical protein